jgi:hypothetical protein
MQSIGMPPTLNNLPADSDWTFEGLVVLPLSSSFFFFPTLGGALFAA